MAPPSPRRSSRARATNTQSQQSSISSIASGRLERNTRSLNKPSSGKSTPSASLSSEPLDDIDDTLLGRRRKRGHEDDQDKPTRSDNTNMVNDVNTIQEEEDEAVRCICGSEEYPGRPPVDGPDADFFTSIELTEDVTGFFVQCDICKVWQHGACVGIFSAESSPDEYFCEQCRKDLHKIHSASNGQKYSKYLPLNRPSRTTSRATSITKDGARSPKLGGSKTTRPNSISQTSKRRSTMNSRDAAYDDEQLRRAIEASKEETTHEMLENNSRRTKRGRSNSEENSTHIKRQRTNSRSASPAIDNTETNSGDNSDEETHAKNGQKKHRQSRHQDKPEKEEKERSRQEASSKRKGRAERRRTEGGGFPMNEPSLGAVLTVSDSDLSEGLPLAVSKTPGNRNTEISHIESVPTTIPAPGTPPAVYPTVVTAQKRSSRGNHKKGRGKNQYTKDKVVDNEESPARSMSRDITKITDEVTISSSSKSLNDQKHGAKTRTALANKMSMLDMKRRVAAIMDFISKTQIDLAAEAPFNRHGATIDQVPQSANTEASSNISKKEQDVCILSESSDIKGFKELSCIEMMDVLTRDMVKWQNQYA